MTFTLTLKKQNTMKKFVVIYYSDAEAQAASIDDAKALFDDTHI